MSARGGRWGSVRGADQLVEGGSLRLIATAENGIGPAQAKRAIGRCDAPAAALPIAWTPSAAVRFVVGVLVGCGCAVGGEAATVRSAADLVRTRDQMTYEGLVESQDEFWVHLIQVHRNRGRTHLVVRPLERSRVAEIVFAEQADRDRLREEIHAFRNRAAVESARMEAVRLRSESHDGGPLLCYDGKWFSLRSTLPENVSRQVVVRLEQVFTAYRQLLPPRVDPARPPEIAVFGTLSAYHDHLARRGVKTDRLALFLPEQNLVAAGSDLNRSAAQLDQFRQDHARLLEELRRLERDLRPRLNESAGRMQQAGVAPEEIAKSLAATRRQLEKEIADKRVEVQRADRRNEDLFGRLAGRMFAQLYHEAFHAYLENFVYPRSEFRVPLWLNEGLAQLFETAEPQSGTLRIDAIDSDRLRRLASELSGDASLPLCELLAAGSDAFLDPQRGRQFYLYSYLLVYYLAFESAAIPSPRLDDYVRPAGAATNPSERFARLAGAEVDSFEPQWRRWVLERRRQRG